MAKSNDKDVLYFIGDIPIRKYNKFTLNFNENEMVKIANLINQSGLSVQKIISILAQPCQKCGNDNTVITIPKGILSVKKGSNGGNIITQSKK